MSGVNKAILVGNLGRDPEVRTTQSGVKVATFSIATTESYRDRDGNRQDLTEWHRIVVWRGLADICERYLRKGSKVYVEGRITHRTYEDQNGQTRNTTEIVAQNMTMLDSRNSGGSGMGEFLHLKNHQCSATRAEAMETVVVQALEIQQTPICKIAKQKRIRTLAMATMQVEAKMLTIFRSKFRIFKKYVIFFC